MEDSYRIQEVEIHYVRPHVSDMVQIADSEEASKLFRLFAGPQKLDYKEFFWVMLLSRSQHALGIAEVAMGSAQGVSVNIKEIFQLALKTNASSIILCHNHPSGSLKPSEADIELTKSISEFGKLIDVRLLDHLIITKEGYCSFLDEGMI